MQFYPIPESLQQPSACPGKLMTFRYPSENYLADHRPVVKEALVYLPYGYDENLEVRYPVLYLMHGGGGDETVFFGTQEGKTPLKNLLDRSIETGAAKPMIVVAPTFTVPGWDGNQREVQVAGLLTQRFPMELKKDLIPAVDAAFRTQPERWSRAFGGFSMGGECTFRVMASCIEQVAVFMPLSGDYWAMGRRCGETHPLQTAQALVMELEKSSVKQGDLKLLAFTGSEDIAYPAMTPMLQELKAFTQWFSFCDEPGAGNATYCVKDGGLHTYEACYEYIRLAVPHLF